MESNIIGEGTLTIHNVAKTIEKSFSFPVLLQRWKQFAYNLEVNEVEIVSLERQINLRTIVLQDVPHEILRIWKASKGSTATLDVLQDALKEAGCLNISDDLDNWLASTRGVSRTLTTSTVTSNEQDNVFNPPTERLRRQLEMVHIPDESLTPPPENSRTGVQVPTTQDEIDYFEDKPLGEGGMGTVFEGLYGERPVAVKVITVSKKIAESVEKEIKIFIDCDSHSNIAKYYGKKMETTGARITYSLAIELCETNLKEWVEQKHLKISRLDILEQMTQGLHHLHHLSNPIIHRDLKPNNILLKRVNGKVLVKLTDFGISSIIADGKTHYSASTSAGTTGWMPPKILQIFKSGKKVRVTTKADIFSLGCLYYYVLTNGSHPFSVAPTSKSEFNPTVIPSELAEGTLYYNYIRLIKLMISYEAGDRPSADDILNHHIFWNYEKQLQFLVEVIDYGDDRWQKIDEHLKDTHSNLADKDYSNMERIFSTEPGFTNGWVECLKEDVLKAFRDRKSKKPMQHNGKSAMNLVKSIRNLKTHLMEKEDFVRNIEVGHPPRDFLLYWHDKDRFPFLLDLIWTSFVKQSRTVNANDDMLKKYYENVDYDFAKKIGLLMLIIRRDPYITTTFCR